MASHDSLPNGHVQLTELATALCEIGKNIRVMNSRSRCSLVEIHIPENESGSSMMPATAKPTLIESLTMACVRVIGNNTAVTIANTQGQFQLNSYKPFSSGIDGNRFGVL
jgi:fumarate hydratase class II